MGTLTIDCMSSDESNDESVRMGRSSIREYRTVRQDWRAPWIQTMVDTFDHIHDLSRDATVSRDRRGAAVHEDGLPGLEVALRVDGEGVGAKEALGSSVSAYVPGTTRDSGCAMNGDEANICAHSTVRNSYMRPRTIHSPGKRSPRQA